MTSVKRTPAGEALTGILLDLFRVNGLLLTAGDRLVARLGLTSARWQILGAIVAGDRSQPVAWLARNLGANRQNVQRIVNDLHKEGLVAFESNPHHRRAQLVVLTDKGNETFDAAMSLQAPWVNSLADGLVIRDIEAVHRVVTTLRKKLEGDNELSERASPRGEPGRLRVRPTSPGTSRRVSASRLSELQRSKEVVKTRVARNR
jgi:DNA-binding MarR family transcriptional regulator